MQGDHTVVSLHIHYGDRVVNAPLALFGMKAYGYDAQLDELDALLSSPRTEV